MLRLRSSPDRPRTTAVLRAASGRSELKTSGTASPVLIHGTFTGTDRTTSKSIDPTVYFTWRSPSGPIDPPHHGGIQTSELTIDRLKLVVRDE